MTTTAFERTKALSLTQRVLMGAIAGVGGGVVFGIMMGMMGMLPMVGMLIGQENASIGFIVHLVISALIGGTYGIVAASLPASWTAHIAGGVVNGVVWWVLGALLLMPLFLGMSQMVFVIGQPQWMSLVGHILYGIVTALLFVPLSGRIG